MGKLLVAHLTNICRCHKRLPYGDQRQVVNASQTLWNKHINLLPPLWRLSVKNLYQFLFLAAAPLHLLHSLHSLHSLDSPELLCLHGLPARHHCHVTRTSSCQLHGELNVSSERWLMWRVTSREHYAAATPPPRRDIAPLHHWLHQPEAGALALTVRHNGA